MKRGPADKVGSRLALAVCRLTVASARAPRAVYTARSAGDGADAQSRMLVSDIRTGVLITIVASFLMVACSAGVNQAAAILDRRDKIGFATPERDWFLRMAPMTREWLQDAGTVPFLNGDALLVAFDDVVAGRAPFTWQVWRWVNYVRWYRLQGFESGMRSSFGKQPG